MDKHHQQETKELELKARAMLKAAKKSEKKVVQAEIIQMQFDLKRRQEGECDSSMSDIGQSSPSLSDNRVDDNGHCNTSSNSSDIGEKKERSEEEETSTETNSGHSSTRMQQQQQKHATNTTTNTESIQTTPARMQQQHTVKTTHIDTTPITATTTDVLQGELNVLVVVDDVHTRTASVDELTPQTNPLHQTKHHHHQSTAKKKKSTVKKEAPMSATTATATTTPATATATPNTTATAILTPSPSNTTLAAMPPMAFLNDMNELSETVHIRAAQMDEIMTKVRFVNIAIK